MLIVPYSAALTLSRPPYVCYAAVLLCLLVYTLQIGTPITGSLVYYPASWNPVTMVSATLAHGGFWHLFGNLVFFMAFAPALEILLSNWIRFVGLMLFIALVTGVSYSLWALGSDSEMIPTLGFSGIVMGMIGLAAYLMPRARIRVFFWLIVWKILYVPAWVLAVVYIGLDAWTMFSATHFGGVNLVAHVAGGLAGYGFGWLWLKDRKQEVSQELADEIEAMRVRQRHGKTREQAHRYRKAMEPVVAEREQKRAQDRFTGRVYQMVKTHRDSEAIVELLTRYDLETDFPELETMFERVFEWGPSRCLACVGRLLIQVLDNEQRHGRVLFYLERCQELSPEFLLPDATRVMYFAQMALDTGKPEVAVGLTRNARERYGSAINQEHCHHLMQKAIRASKPII